MHYVLFHICLWSFPPASGKNVPVAQFSFGLKCFEFGRSVSVITADLIPHGISESGLRNWTSYSALSLHTTRWHYMTYSEP